MLQVRDLSVAFGPIQPLSGVSFSIERGETLGIVGEVVRAELGDGHVGHGSSAAARRANHRRQHCL